MTRAIVVKAEPGGEPECRKQKPTVLVVEDEVLIRLMIADTLRANGLNVVEASNCDEAVAVLRSSVPLDIVLTDMRMPHESDGLVLARLVRETRPELKLIIAASHATEEHLALADAFFCKPYDLIAVVSRIKHFLAGSPDATRPQ